MLMAGSVLFSPLILEACCGEDRCVWEASCWRTGCMA